MLKENTMSDALTTCDAPFKVMCFLCGTQMHYEGARAEAVDDVYDIVYTWSCPCASVHAEMRESEIKQNT